MKTTITIEIETEGFRPLYGYDEDGIIIDENNIVYSEKEFHADLKRFIANALDHDNVIEQLADEGNCPEDWDYLEDFAQKLSVKIDGKEMDFPRRGWNTWGAPQ